MKVSMLARSIAALNHILDTLPENMPGDVVITALASFGPPVSDFLLAFRKDSAQIIHDPTRTYPDSEIYKFFVSKRELRRVFADELQRKSNKIDRVKLREVFYDLYYATSTKPVRSMYPKLKPGYVKRLVWGNRGKVKERWGNAEVFLFRQCKGCDLELLKKNSQQVLKFAFQLKAGYCKGEIPDLARAVEEIHFQQRLNFKKSEPCS